MAKSNGVIDPAKTDTGEMFVGWSKAPKVDRRFFLGTMPFALGAMGGIAYLSAGNLGDPGAGAWLTNATHKVTGLLVNEPYKMIRIEDPSAPFGMRSVLVLAQGKCTSSIDLSENNASMVTPSGALIERKDRRALEVSPFIGDWLSSTDQEASKLLQEPPVISLGETELQGMIMDSKCFFGVMRPARGKTHKACASLCIRGGIPPSFWVRTKNGEEAVLLMTTRDGGPMPMEILLSLIHI